MKFISLVLKEDGSIIAEAEGHPDEVVRYFREVSSLLLGNQGPWRITEVQGQCPDEISLDSGMTWKLTSKVKNPLHQALEEIRGGNS